ncbi:Stromal membrane-associated protein 1 [Mactra antiquata]
MSTRSEKERQKAQQEKFQAVLSNLLKDDDNKYCVDCDAKGPRWASWNLGIFLCIRCAGIHRNLGVHISKVKSVNLDTWTPEQIAMMMEVGNSRARAAYEANLPDSYRRPQANGALESFIRAKYEQKKYIAKEWVQPKPVVPRELLDDDKDKKKSKPKTSGNITLSSAPRSQSNTNTETQTPSQVSKPSNPKPVQSSQVTVPQQPAAPAPKSSNTGDLIGLDAPATSTTSSNSLLDDFMGGSTTQVSSQPVQSSDPGQVSNGSLEANLFGEPASTTEKTPNVSTKDSIMALYGGQQSQQQFGVPGGVYMPQQQMGPTGMYGMAQPQAQPQNMAAMNMPQQGMYGNQMGMMGMNQAQMNMGQMGMPQGQMGMPQGQMGMYGQQQPQMQQMQFNQMQQQMGNMNLGQQQPQMSMGWSGPQSSGQTLSTNLWQ